MALYVQKFGGTSVGSIERINAVADIVAKAKAEGHQVVVVSSAMSGETDRLINLAKEVQSPIDSREYSSMVSTGEQVAIALIAMALKARGLNAKSMLGHQVPITTSDDHKKARIQSVGKENINSLLESDVIPVIAGFQGVNAQGDVTTLGRGGSDTSAVAIAAALGADECQIYTDVDGVYTTDPRVVSRAKRLEQITFEEMLELASLGAKVLQIRSVEFAGKYNVPLRVLSSFNPGSGTLISYEGKPMEDALVSGIAFNRSEAKLTILGVPDTPGVAYQLLGPVSDAGIGIDMIIQNIAADGRTDFTFTVHRDEYQSAMELLQQIANKLGANEVVGDDHIVKISLVGVGMRSHAGIASTMFDVLGREGINIQMISTSEIKISVVVDEKYLELGVRTLHSAFGLDKEADEETDPL